MAKFPEKPPEKPKVAVDFTLLSDQDRQALREEARKQVLSEMAQATRDVYYNTELDKQRRARIPDEMLVPVTIDIASFTPYIMIDEKQYFHGVTYNVPVKLRAVLLEQMDRTHRHQDEIDGRSRFVNRSRGIRIGPQHSGVSAESILKV